MFKTIVAAFTLFCACSDDTQVTCEEARRTYCEVQQTCVVIRDERDQQLADEALESCITAVTDYGSCDDNGVSPGACLEASEAFVWDCSKDFAAQLQGFAPVDQLCWGEAK